MRISRNNVDKTCAKPQSDTVAYLDRWASWITQQSHPPMVYGAFQRNPSSNLSRPLLGMVMQDGAGVDRWTINGITYPFADQQAVILSCAQGSQSGPCSNTGGLWISSFELPDTSQTKKLFDDHTFAPFNVKQMPALRQAFLHLFACKQRNDMSPCPMHLKAAWLHLLALMQDELHDNASQTITTQRTSKHKKVNRKASNRKPSEESIVSNSNTPNAAAHTSRLPPENIARAIDHINQHYANASITQQTLAQAACLDPHHFGRLFKASLGQTPMQYLRLTRLRQAAFLLTNTSKNITTIAHEVGLNEPQHFARLFKRMHSQSPTDWRNRRP